MDLPELQRTVAAFVTSAGLETTVEARTLDLTSEVGELAKECLKGTDYGRRPFQLPFGWEGELGDVFFALVCLANTTGVDLAEALDVALEKYRQRRGEQGDPGSGR